MLGTKCSAWPRSTEIRLSSDMLLRVRKGTPCTSLASSSRVERADLSLVKSGIQLLEACGMKGMLGSASRAQHHRNWRNLEALGKGSFGNGKGGSDLEILNRKA
mmetsp:Transcript_11000/g.24598  ORF Transcript_11000/g.24598 Transcript_11000/m.24598 type:complete len:104 (+) Transcript_11000:1009-1320(+)